MRDPDDPVLALLRELARAHPRCDLSVVICPEDLGLNPKISTLRQLMPRARYDLLVIADGDVLVGPDYLAQVAAAFRQPGVGLVSCPYRAGPSRTLGSALEALTIAADFIPSVAVANYVEGIRFALGATMALTRQALTAIGGLAPLADFLADDYQLGFRVAQTGLQVKILPYVVETNNPEMSFRIIWPTSSAGPAPTGSAARRVIWPTASPTPWCTASPSSWVRAWPPGPGGWPRPPWSSGAPWPGSPSAAASRGRCPCGPLPSCPSKTCSPSASGSQVSWAAGSIGGAALSG